MTEPGPPPSERTGERLRAELEALITRAAYETMANCPPGAEPDWCGRTVLFGPRTGARTFQIQVPGVVRARFRVTVELIGIPEE